MSNLTLSSRKAFGNVSNVKSSTTNVERGKLASLKGDRAKDKGLKELKDVKVKEKGKASEKGKPSLCEKKSSDILEQKEVDQKASPSFEQENGPITVTKNSPLIDDLELEDFHPPPIEQQSGRFFPIHELYHYHDEGPIPVCEESASFTPLPLTFKVDFDDLF